LRLADRLEHHLLDIRDGEALAELVAQVQPDYVFHLAAQPLVRSSYMDPVGTYATNVMGTVHVLEALRRLQDEYRGTNGRVCGTVMVTTDKCYENREWVHGYREDDPLGGHDPYSSSKAAAELAIASYRQSFFGATEAEGTPRVGISSARAGNVIGGGDWAVDRIVPDCVRHLQRGEAIRVRNPRATRPWQHVLEPLGGYLLLAQRQRAALEAQDGAGLERLCSAFNFGPVLSSNRPVGALVSELLRHWPGEWRVADEPAAPHEAGKLNLAWDKAFHLLGWEPRWGFEEAVARTMRLYRAQKEGQNVQALVGGDIAEFGGMEQPDLCTPVTR
jgi:CDP-glucose 4,6-dehydratase